MSLPGDARVRKSGFQPVQVLAALTGLLFLVLGVAGFLRTGFSDFTSNEPETIVGFMINPLHNAVHTAIGVLGLLCSAASPSARMFGWILFLGYGVVSVWGLMITGVISSNPVSGLGNPLNLDAADNWLHVLAALVGLIMALMPARKRVMIDESDVDTASMVLPPITDENVPGNADVPTRPVPQQMPPAQGRHRPSRWRMHRPGRTAH
ncbi:hypothetical protein GCM10017786_56150 [Amycolatopsis deserti]|uniref:DUF4383 domain-containing protein n=1 Tax=Amycolatopsis deserti TaxID=185696 RepID=A0ABQ3JAZ0_9PSEU|nr:DUF4383 domain-containing protein [Amycolatopsis deserti]GHF15167.1 hypothetical protein GCM10017786_56150 [Amycolatopsis deserti]